MHLLRFLVLRALSAVLAILHHLQSILELFLILLRMIIDLSASSGSTLEFDEIIL